MLRTMTVEATRTELAVLGLLAWAGETSGYELHKRAERSVGFIWSPARSQLYAVLKRLQAQGSPPVATWSKRTAPTSGCCASPRPAVRTLREWLDRVDAIEPEDHDGVLLKLFFGAFGDADAAHRQLVDYGQRVRDRLATFRAIERTFDGEDDAEAVWRLQTLRLGIALMEARLAWAEDTLRAVTPAAASKEAT